MLKGGLGLHEQYQGCVSRGRLALLPGSGRGGVWR